MRFSRKGRRVQLYERKEHMRVFLLESRKVKTERDKKPIMKRR